MRRIRLVRRKETRKAVPPDRKAVMVKALRAAVAKALQGYRQTAALSPEAAARSLGWPLSVYLDLEAGKVMPSKGQQEDIRRVIRSAISTSAPADVHYRSFAHQVEDEQRDDRLTTAECGLFPPGDVIADYRKPQTVTCVRCQLTPAWVDAARIYRNRPDRLHFE